MTQNTLCSRKAAGEIHIFLRKVVSAVRSYKANSQLANFLTISFIPRYVLLSKDGILKNLDMPKPSNQLEFAKKYYRN